MNEKHTFNKSGYAALIQDLYSEWADILPVKDYAKFGNKILLRHDVDNDLQASLDMARMENSLGIRSTYFILNTAPYWSDMKLPLFLIELNKLGHEIGWHNNAITEHLQTGKPLRQCVEEPINSLRNFAEITGTASHGDPLCHSRGYLNYYVFKGTKHNLKFPNLFTELFNLTDFGLEYEAYHIGHTHYISDSGGVWSQDNEKVIKSFSETGGMLQVLIHPQWWAL